MLKGFFSAIPHQRKVSTSCVTSGMQHVILGMGVMKKGGSF